MPSCFDAASYSNAAAKLGSSEQTSPPGSIQALDASTMSKQKANHSYVWVILQPV
ncbi:hypothetical protein [Spirosoma radiotolerans]|uniref:hypothetical protein n=1 Tax=Spirosoma radiotolerans TaxID=1379870 RepID=UPI000B189D27|nr:hypothetical protein [Spirosoma radiotolerans]